MALIKNASNSFTKGLNEAYGVTTAALKGQNPYDKIKRDYSKGYFNPGGVFGNVAQASAGPIVTAPSKGYQSYEKLGPAKPAAITAGRSGIDITGGGSQAGGSSVQGFKTDGSETADQLDFLRRKQQSAINDNYDSEISRLNNEKKRANKAYGETIAQAEAYYPEFQRLVGDQQTSTEGQITGLENARKYESERALGQARQLLNDLNRRQYAQMSATGNYGSSVPEAFADQFGNKAYAAQSQIQQSRDQALGELGQKRVDAKQYFDQKLFEGKQKYDTLVSSLKSQLNAQLDAIANAKGVASQAKNAQGIEAWNNYVNNKFSLDQELRNYQNQLTQYTAESDSLTDPGPFKSIDAAEINSSENQNILGDANQRVADIATLSGNMPYNQAPIYQKRKLTPDEQSQYGGTIGNQITGGF